MNNTISIRFLKKFSQRELKGLDVFITNPYFNANEDVIKLYQYIAQFAPNYNQPNFTAEKAFKAVYPSRAFDSAVLNRLMSNLYTVIKKFINCTYNAPNPEETEFNALRFCVRRFPERFDNQLKKVRSVAKKHLKGADFYHYTLEVEELLTGYLALSGLEDNFDFFSKTLDQFYWLSKLPLFCEMLNCQIITPQRYDLSQLEAHLAFLQQIEYTQFPLIHLWHCATLALNNVLHKPSILPDDYLQFKALLLQNKDSLSSNEARNLYVYLKRTLIKVSFDDRMYSQELFDLYQIGLKEKFIFYEGFLLPRDIINLINAAIRSGNIKWADSFLVEYGSRFWPDDADEVALSCRAIINFYKGNYNVALQQTNKMTFKDAFFRFVKRVKRMQIYYETDEIPLLGEQVKDFRVFLYRNKSELGEANIQPYRNFTSFISRLAYMPYKDKEKIEKLENDIQHISIRELPEKQWLLQKLDELK